MLSCVCYKYITKGYVKVVAFCVLQYSYPINTCACAYMNTLLCNKLLPFAFCLLVNCLEQDQSFVLCLQGT